MRARVLLSREVFPAAMRRAPLAWQFSSVGSVNEAWLEQMRLSLSEGKYCTAGAFLTHLFRKPAPATCWVMPLTYFACLL